MPRLKRGGAPAATDTRALRLRAAWLYYNQNLTQKAIAERLGLSRPTVIRLIEAAVKRAEVQVWIAEDADELVALGVALEERLRLDQAIVVPAADGAEGTAKAVGLALGRFLSGIRFEGCRVGVGWGRTLTASLASFRPARPRKAEVLSLLGGVVSPDLASPIEFTWRLAAALEADCYLMPAPLMVDSAETKRRLVEDCGLKPLFDLGGALDIAVIGAGELGRASTSLAARLITPAERDELIGLGAVCETLCTFLDRDGREVDHPINGRVMSLGLDAVAAAGHVVLAAGGAGRAETILAVHRRLAVDTLITDESAAEAILALSA